MAVSHDRHAGHSVAMFRDKFWLTFALPSPSWSGAQTPSSGSATGRRCSRDRICCPRQIDSHVGRNKDDAPRRRPPRTVSLTMNLGYRTGDD